MKNSKFVIPLVLTFISSCSSMKHFENLTASSEAHENKTQVPLNFNLENKFRSPASIEDNPLIYNTTNELEFEKIMQSKDIKQFSLRLQLHFDAIEEVYLRSNTALREFDEILNNSVQGKEDIDAFFKKVIDSGSYSKILALRENNLAREEQLIYFFKRFYQIISDSSSSEEEKEFAKNAFEYMGKYYRSLPKKFLIAHFQIALDLSHLDYNTVNWNLGLRRVFGMIHPNVDDIPELISKYQENFETPEVEQKIKELSLKLSGKKTDISEEIKKSTYMIQASFVNDPSSRMPQSDRIEPSTGHNGNITGNTFNKGVWAITYDDGPHNVYTNQIANNLKSYGIKSTFFSLSKNVLAYPQITKGLKEMGMEIANHSHDHAQLTKLDDAKLNFEIIDSTRKIEEVTGVHPKFFRCPYGAGTNIARIRSKIAKENMVHVFWNVDSLDWQDRNPASIVARVKKEMALSKKGGGIILFHDIHPQSVIASKEIMKYLKEDLPKQGVATEVKTIGEIVDEINNEKK